MEKVLEDPRVKEWPLMSSPWPTLCICISYAVFVKSIGPKLMQNRKPLNLRWIMIIYNFVMTLLSFYIFYRMGIHGWFGKYNYRCQPVDYSGHPDAVGMLHMSYWYFLSKFLEFTDTLFFVLRKKNSHVSTLHVIHHGVMPLSVWWGVKYTPGGHSTFFSFINCLVHVLMYTYYGIAAIGPNAAKYLWWKKHITTIQMIQFVMIFIHSFQLLFRQCDYPRSFMYWIGMHAVLFLFLFMDFYKTAYLRSKAAAAAAAAATKNGTRAKCNGTKHD
ncbi:ELOVL7 [Cordylochernes scorpioides]|uniref:Elongation of very long chain fatty acids protein n=1 Tax=Cordylochernes scorpioides TaxID=51811 RepID=A0ABY6LGZ4_9ARAC|nr:ELOVL7 [Cordylochernes scorpioides]